jgi:outer membrane protein assembly factor BamB
LLFNDLVIVDVGTVVAFEQETGRVRWTSGEDETAYASPATILRGLDLSLVVLNGWGVRILNPLDGKEYASLEWRGSGINVASPVVAGNHVFITSGYANGCSLLKFNDDRLEEVYFSKVMASHVHTPVLHDGHIYGFHGNVTVAAAEEGTRGVLKCIDLATGKEKWNNKTLGYGSVLRAGSRLIILTEVGELIAAEASPDGYRELGRATVLRDRTWTVPTLVNGRLFCRSTRGELVCLDVLPAKERMKNERGCVQ